MGCGRFWRALPRPPAVAVCSTAALLPHDAATEAACLAGDETSALSVIARAPELAYMSSKCALSLWLRRTAVSAEWAGAGVLMNGRRAGRRRNRHDRTALR